MEESNPGQSAPVVPGEGPPFEGLPAGKPIREMTVAEIEKVGRFWGAVVLPRLEVRGRHLLHGRRTPLLEGPEEAAQAYAEVFLRRWQDYDPAYGHTAWIEIHFLQWLNDRLKTRRKGPVTVGLSEDVEDHGAAAEWRRLEERELVRRALGLLSKKEQRILELAYWDGRTHRQIAADPECCEQLGLEHPATTAATRKRLSRAHKKLRLLFQTLERPHDGGADTHE